MSKCADSHLRCVNDSEVIPTMTTQPQYCTFKHLYHEQKPTHTSFSSYVSHTTSLTTAVSLPISNQKHAVFVDQWPWAWGMWLHVYFLFCSACACVDLTPALRADWLLIPWCVFRPCSHSYCIYGCVLAHLANHAHSHSPSLVFPSALLSAHLQKLSPRNPFHCHFISSAINLKDKAVLKTLTEHLCGGHAWVKLPTSDSCVEEHVQSSNRILRCIFPLHAMFSHPSLFSQLWSLHTGAEISVFHGVGHRERVCVQREAVVVFECVGMWCAEGEGAQVESRTSTSRGLLCRIRPCASSALSVLGACVYVGLRIHMYVRAHVSLDLSQPHVHPSVILLMYISDDCACTCVRRAVRLAVCLLWSTHLRVIMKATFDFNLSWNLPLFLFS